MFSVIYHFDSGYNNSGRRLKPVHIQTESTLPGALCLVDALNIKNFLRNEQPSYRYRTAKTVTTVGNKARVTSNYLKKAARHGHTVGIQTGRSLYDSLLAWSTSNFQTGTENCCALADLKMLVTLGFLLNTFKWDLHEKRSSNQSRAPLQEPIEVDVLNRTGEVIRRRPSSRFSSRDVVLRENGSGPRAKDSKGKNSYVEFDPETEFVSSFPLRSRADRRNGGKKNKLNTLDLI